MVGAELDASHLIPPFLVYNGTKRADATNLQQTNWYKYRNWNKEALGRTARVMFQKKHWFDADITIEWLDFLLDKTYRCKKVGLIWDTAGCNTAEQVAKYIENHKDRLIVAQIYGGLTSVLQFCDLVASKLLKQLIKERYYNWKTDFIRAEREKIVANGRDLRDVRIKVKVLLPVMIGIVEESFKAFNIKQRETGSARMTFRKVNQDPWNDHSDKLAAHINSLSLDSMYKDSSTCMAAEDLENTLNLVQ
eukprot:CCRYP_015999-RA/>CCRYP_015999-RA protein AED:0.04 eAED:-0.04 QI:0/-1/0/1/-1/1/1/0/248